MNRHRSREAGAETARVVVRVESLAPGGAGFGRLEDGRAAFVEGAFPGDLVELRVGRSKKSWVAGAFERLLEAGAARRVPPCAHAERCGGCDWMALPEDAQSRHKVEGLRAALVHTGRFAPSELPTFAALERGAPLRYRSRIRLAHRGGRLGFFARSTHEIVEIDDCLVAGTDVFSLVRELRAWLRRSPHALEGVEALEVRVLGATRRGSLALHRAKGATVPSEVLEKLASELALDAAFAFAAPAVLERLELPEETYTYVPIGGFSQVNLAVNARLIERVLGFRDRLGASTFLDLYSGSGNFSLPLARKAKGGRLVESAAPAIDAARRALDEQGLSGIESVTADVAGEAERLVRSGRTFELVVVDPPRAGAKGATAAIAALATRGIAMVSCDPVTLARDLRELVDAGWRLEGIDPFDMFPETHHLETVVTLVR